MLYNLMNGNSLELLKTLQDNSVDAIVTDPPYGLSQHSQGDIVNALTAWLAGEEYTHGKAGFMGKAWDSFVPSPMLFKECYRVLKHGGHKGECKSSPLGYVCAIIKTRLIYQR